MNIKQLFSRRYWRNRKGLKKLQHAKLFLWNGPWWEREDAINCITRLQWALHDEQTGRIRVVEMDFRAIEKRLLKEYASGGVILNDKPYTVGESTICSTLPKGFRFFTEDMQQTEYPSPTGRIHHYTPPMWNVRTKVMSGAQMEAQQKIAHCIMEQLKNKMRTEGWVNTVHDEWERPACDCESTPHHPQCATRRYSSPEIRYGK